MRVVLPDLKGLDFGNCCFLVAKEATPSSELLANISYTDGEGNFVTSVLCYKKETSSEITDLQQEQFFARN